MRTKPYFRSRTSWSKGIDPQPVYVAAFDDGTTARLTFFQRKGKTWDFERGRRLFSLSSFHGHKRIVAGHVEVAGEVAAIDPLNVVALKPKRGPQAKTVLRQLMAYLDGESEDASVIDTARALVAA